MPDDPADREQQEVVMQGEDSAAAGQSQRRSYGTGSLYARTDRSGRDTWYGYWRTAARSGGASA
jgi:hypothetical protein